MGLGIFCTFVFSWAFALPAWSAPTASQTVNFLVYGADAQQNLRFAAQAERVRKSLAIDWVGAEIPQWNQRATIRVSQIGAGVGAGGSTSFVFERGRVYAFKSNIQGSEDRIFDSVIPHEVLHMILASYFRQPVPRWADEGLCTSVESPSEMEKIDSKLSGYLQTSRGIPFRVMLEEMEYPSDVMPLYAQGRSVTQFLIGRKGKKAFMEFIRAGLVSKDWDDALEKHYGALTDEIERQWLDWLNSRKSDIPAAHFAQSEPQTRR